MRGQNLIIAVITALVASHLDSSLALQCYECVSTGNENCITNASSQPSKDCSTNCFTSTDGKGLVTRGCLPAGNITCPDATNCPTCNTDKCNTNNVCYKCTGASCNTVDATMLTACAGDSSKCFTTGSSDTNMTRGCTADTEAAYKCPADTTDTSCAICDAGQCNSLTYTRTDGGSCIVCPDCAGVQDTTTNSKACTVLYNQPVGCYATTSGARGCLASLEGGCPEATCKSCTGNNCNTAGQEFQCIACLSNEVANCWAGTGEGLPTVACPNGTCFGGIWNGLGVRDCLTAGSELMQYQCVNHISPYQCNTCNTTSLCNNWKLNGAGSLSQSVGMVGLLLGLLVVLRSA